MLYTVLVYIQVAEIFNIKKAHNRPHCHPCQKINIKHKLKSLRQQWLDLPHMSNTAQTKISQPGRVKKSMYIYKDIQDISSVAHFLYTRSNKKTACVNRVQ